MWRRLPLAQRETVALVRVETPSSPLAQMTVVTPTGIRVEGIGLDQVIRLLRELA